MSHNDLSNNDLIVPSYLHAPMEESGLLVRSVRSVPMEVSFGVQRGIRAICRPPYLVRMGRRRWTGRHRRHIPILNSQVWYSTALC